jgi:hypothetical protein
MASAQAGACTISAAPLWGHSDLLSELPPFPGIPEDRSVTGTTGVFTCLKSRSAVAISFVAILLLSSVARAAAAPKLESIGPCSEASVPDSLKKELAQLGYRVTLADGSIVEFWPSAQITPAAKPREDATYNLAPSTFAGVIHFSVNTRDYRGDAIPAGFYNLRYQLQPTDGDHLGTSPTPDFLLLVPPAQDTDPNKTYSFEQLIELSGQVTGKKHPGPLNLVPPDAKTFPSVNTDSEDHTILFFKLKTQSGELPMALVIKGTTSS